MQIINQAIIQSGVPVNVSFENNASFGLQQRSFLGARFDYLAKSTSTETLNIGGTIERLNERPFFSKTDYGQDPIRNTMYGADVNYRGQLPQLTSIAEPSLHDKGDEHDPMRMEKAPSFNPVIRRRSGKAAAAPSISTTSKDPPVPSICVSR